MEVRSRLKHPSPNRSPTQCVHEVSGASLHSLPCCKCPRYQYPICRCSNEDSLQGRESERGGKTAGNPRDDNSSSRFSSPYLSLSAIDANGRSDSPVPIRFPPFFPPSQPGARTRREVNWILAPFFPLPSLAARSLLLPSYSPTALCHCRFCACWENASHKYHLARRPPANVASNQRRLELHTRAPLAAIDFSPSPPTAPQGDGGGACV